MRYVVIAVLVLIVASLGSALFFMLKGGRDDPKKMAKALAIRVGLSVFLFVMLIVGWAFGLWQPGRL